jgi:glycosyltransferase involved in cell wall biosynthesis
MTGSAFSWPTDVFVLIPAYRAASSLRAVLRGLFTIVPPENVCVSDDGSHDDTGDVCRELAVHLVSSETNEGKGAALSRGFHFLLAEKKASWVFTMDADGQHAASDIPKFLSEIRANPGAGIIIGKRSTAFGGGMPFARIFSNTVTSFMLSALAKSDIPDSQCGFRAYSARLLSSVTCRYKRFEMESEIILRAREKGFSISSVAVQTLYCSTQSHISVVADTLRWLKAVVSIRTELRIRSKYRRHAPSKT